MHAYVYQGVLGGWRLVPSVDGVASEVTHQVAVATESTAHVVVQLAVDTQVEGLAGT